MNFLVIFPVLRAIDLLNTSLGSVLLQSGDFDLHVHVQSADPSGETQALVERWLRWLEESNLSKRRKLSIRTEKDFGLYDGIALAVEAIAPDDDCVMTWLGSDDVLLPNSLATVKSIRTQNPHIKWLTGLHFLSAPDGANCSTDPNKIFHRDDLANGRHDGRTAPFVMQEGTFWTVDLWRRAGGVNRTFKLAGDWDLWRRFAQLEPLYEVDFPLGKFSMTPGRLSEDLSQYYREVDAMLPTLSRAECDDRAYKVSRQVGRTEWEVRVKRRPAIIRFFKWMRARLASA